MGALAAVATVIGVLAPTAALALPDPAPGDVTSLATLDKTASVSTVSPGETFTYTLTIGCSAITDLGCRGAVLSDTVPAPFVLVDATVGGGVNTAAPPVISGNTVTVNWTTPLGDDTTGILDATTGIVNITAILPADTSYDLSGIAATNNAVIEGTNFVDAFGEVDVTPIIDLVLQPTAAKTITPDNALGTAGTQAAISLSGGNQSNATVDSLTIQDPRDGTTPNPFDYLAFTGFGAVTPPVGTTQTQYFVLVDGSWIEAPGGVVPPPATNADVNGTRVVFTGAIPAGATATVGVNTQLTPAGAALPDQTQIVNTVETTIERDGETGSADASATFTVRKNTVTVAGSKTFLPSLVIAGEPSVVTISGTNTSTIPIQVLDITEPSSGSFPDAYDFTGFVGPVTWPAATTTGEVIYTFDDGTTETVPFGSATTPSDPTTHPLEEVASFQLVFRGVIQPNSSVTARFGVDTDPNLGGLPTAVPNEIGIHGENEGVDGDATAGADLYIYSEVIETYVNKQMRPDEILAVPGQITTVTLAGGLNERPNPPTTTTGSTGRADQVVIQDPADPVAPDPWWNAFDLTAITQTPVPGDATLTVEYYDTTTGAWETLAGPIAGPTIYSQQVRASVSAVAGGVRFVYDYTGADGGFAPGTDFAPNFTASLRGDGRYTPGPPFDDTNPTTLTNCGQTGATSPTPGVADAMRSATDSTPCDDIVLTPPDPGNADIVDKSFGTSSSGGVKSAVARSGDTIPSTLNWSTGGYSGISTMTITDVAAPETTPIAASVYNAFNLTRIQPITAATDPLIVYDAVTPIQLFNGTTWVTAANNPCNPRCVGQFPGMNLTAAEQASTTAVRIAFVESPNRAAASAGAPDAPPVGSGVARSLSNSRPITLAWQLRDTRRSDGTAVLGDELYNLPTAGLNRNTVNATGVFANGDPSLSANDADDALIVDVPLTTTTTKTWSGGPLAVPPDPNVPASQFPITRATITTRNTTPARVDELVITDPSPSTAGDPAFDPFEYFSLAWFSSITVPAGATSTVVTLTCPNGSTIDYTREAALALRDATMPCDVAGVRVAFDGRIAANAAGTVELTLRLRAFTRSDAAVRVTPAFSPVPNTAQGVIADVDPPGACPPPTGTRFACDEGTATMVLAEPSFGVTSLKLISPAAQKEDDFSPVTVTLRGQPTGSARTVSMTLEDDDPTFWNAFDFTAMSPAWALPAPLETVQTCYLSGGSFTPTTVAAGTVGGTWTCQPTGSTVAAATAFLAAAPADLHGVRFIVAQANGLGWTDPPAPVVNIPVVLERRVDLRSGGPVPTTRSDQVPAPGEAVAGEYVDTLRVNSESVQLGPGQRFTASSTATSNYRNLHLEASINVAKSPSGDVRPGTVIPFKLEFTNTGEQALTEVVFTDELPLDGGGQPQLIFDPDRDPSVPPWSFELSGSPPAPSNGSPLPTDPSQVAVDTSDPTRIVFTMPTGSVLEVGQTYTITLRMMIRPGVTAGTPVTNTTTMSIAEPLDGCVPSYDAVNDWCYDTSTVTPLAVPAVSTVKSVRAAATPDVPGVPVVRSDINGYSCDGAADALDFYRYPCVVTTLPGDLETWRFTVQNVGTLPLDTVVSMDKLPQPGDAGLIVQVPRGSQWMPTYVGGVQLQPTATTPTGATMTTYYSTSNTPCTADLNPVGRQCAPGAWTLLDGSVDPATVRSLKFVVTFPGALFDPGDTLDITFVTQTTPTARVDRPYPTAYNTVSTGGAAVQGASRVVVPATEGRRVGVSYPTGPIDLNKVLSGSAQQFAPATFEVQLTCTLDEVPIAGIPSVELAPGIPQQFTGLPYGSVCTATEGQNGQTQTIIGTATVGGPNDSVEIVEVENVFDPASLIIRKSVDSDAVNSRGVPFEYGPFTFTVTCVDFAGNPAYAIGYGPGTPMTQSIMPDEVWALGGLPGTGTCTVSETDDLGASGTTMISSLAGTVIDTVDGTSIDVALDSTTAVEVLATNEFPVGSLALEKVVEGDADVFANGPWNLVVDCALDTGSGPSQVWLGVVSLGGDQPLTATIDDIATGAVCTVTEPLANGATTVDIAPPTVTIGDGTTVEVTVTNTYDAGTLTVTKAFAGDGVDLWGTGPFEVTLDCVDPLRGPVPIPGGATRQLSADNGYTTTYDPLLIGLLCAIDETDTGGATTSEITDANGDPVSGVFRIDGQDAEFTATNTFDLGSIVVTKTVSGADASAHQDIPFTILTTCEWAGAEIAMPGGGERTLTVADPVTYDDLPAGAECTIREIENGGATAVAFSPADPFDPTRATVTVGTDAAASITIDNRFDPLPPTGVDGVRYAGVAGIGAVLLLVGALLVRRRREA